MFSARLTQLIAANQIAGAIWVALATLVFGVSHDSALEIVLAVALTLSGLLGGVLALRSSRVGITILVVVLLLQIIRFANVAFAWQFYLGATWRLTIQPTAGTDFGLEVCLTIPPWPAGAGCWLSLNFPPCLPGATLWFGSY